MTGFAAEASALSSASNTFESLVAPIHQQAAKLDTIQGSASTSGTYYGAQGSAYHEAITGKVKPVVDTYGDRTSFVAGGLQTNATNYQQRDEGNAADLRSSGTGA